MHNSRPRKERYFMTNIKTDFEKPVKMPVAQFIIDRESRKILEADSQFLKLTGIKPGTGKNAVVLDSLLQDDLASEIAGAIKSGIKKGGTLAYACIFRFGDRGEVCGVISLQPYMVPGIRNKIICVISVFEEEAATAEQNNEKEAAIESKKDKQTKPVKDIKKESNEKKKQTAELKTLADLKEAIDNDEFEVYIHPIYSIDSNTALGGEILTHWERAGSDLGTAGFFPQFDEEELASELDFYILTRSLQALKYADEEKREKLLLSFNLSNQIFQAPGFVERLTALVEAFDVKTSHIMLEIKEDLIVSGMYNIIEQIGELRENGFKVIIDSISGDARLLPLLEGRKVDMIKLNQDLLLRSIAQDSSKDFFKVIYDTAAMHKVDIICARIETEKQKLLAKQAGCIMAQGYLMSRPKLLEDFLAE
jgi:two-component system CheB/CheR fusion protein